jgi:hypothetical protein
MPLVARYFVYVGGVLLALLFVVDACLPKLPVVEASDSHMPVIRIYAQRQGPGPIVFDTNAAVPTAAVVAAASVPPPVAVSDTTSSVRDALAQLPPPDAAKVQPADAKKAEAKQPPPRKFAKRHTAPQRLASHQPQFAWFGPRMW